MTRVVRSLLPPKLRNWRKGTNQLGIFLRSKDGTVFEMVRDVATEQELAFVYALIDGLKRISPELAAGILQEMKPPVAPKEDNSDAKG